MLRGSIGSVAQIGKIKTVKKKIFHLLSVE